MITAQIENSLNSLNSSLSLSLSLAAEGEGEGEGKEEREGGRGREADGEKESGREVIRKHGSFRAKGLGMSS